MAGRAPVFAGSASGLTPLPGARVSVNPFGMSVLSRPYHAPRASAKSLVPSVGSIDIYYPNLRATGFYEIEEGEGLTCKLNVEFKGLIDGAIPDPLIGSDISTGSVSATSGDDGDAEDQRTWEVVFSSPRRIYNYITDGRPTGPRFNDYVGGPVDAPSIIYQSIRDGNGRPRGSASGISLSARATLASLTANPVPGTSFYEVSEVWAGEFSMTS